MKYSIWFLSSLSCFLYNSVHLFNSLYCFIVISDHHSLFILPFLSFSLNFFNPLFFPRIPWIINQSETEWVMWQGAPVSEHAEGRRRKRKGEEIWWVRSRRLKKVVLTLQSKTEDISSMKKFTSLGKNLLRTGTVLDYTEVLMTARGTIFGFRYHFNLFFSHR